MCRLAQDTVELYAGLDLDGEPVLVRGWLARGRDEPRAHRELKRRLGFARSYGIEGTELLTPEETAERIPL